MQNEPDNADSAGADPTPQLDDDEIFVENEKKPGTKIKIVAGELICLVADCLAKRFRKHEIKEAIRDALQLEERPNSHIVEALISKARQLQCDRARQKLGINLEEAQATFEACIRDPKSSWADKLRAQQGLNELHGLNALARQVLGTAGSGSPEEKATLAREALRAMQSRMNELAR